MHSRGIGGYGRRGRLDHQSSVKRKGAIVGALAKWQTAFKSLTYPSIDDVILWCHTENAREKL